MVSVLMTVFNRELFLAEAIESVLASSYADFELIIVDDVSTDNSFDIAKSYEARDKRVRVFKNQKNLGDYGNRNQAASYAKGEYIKFLDSDDAIFPWGLAYCVKEMNRHPQAALGTLSFRESNGETCLGSSDAIKEHFFEKEFLNIGPSGTIFRSDAFRAIGFFDTRFGIAADNYVNIKLAALYPVVLLPQEFFMYRKHDGQELHNSYFKYLLNNFRLKRKLSEENILPLSITEQKELMKKYNKEFLYKTIISLRNPRDWRRTLDVFRKAGFGYRDLRSVFN